MHSPLLLEINWDLGSFCFACCCLMANGLGTSVFLFYFLVTAYVKTSNTVVHAYLCINSGRGSSSDAFMDEYYDMIELF